MTKSELTQLYYKEEKTLEQIGNIYGVTRERIRQIMEKLGLKRRNNPHRYRLGYNKCTSLQQYFEQVKKTGKEMTYVLHRLLLIARKCCQECGSTKNLHQHHLKYPAKSGRDVEFLCASCHLAKHRKGNGSKKQLEICREYINGKSGCLLAKEHKVHPTLIYYFLRKWNIETRSPKRANKLSPEERNQKRKEYYWENRDRLLAYKKEHYQQNKEEIKARRRARYWNKKLALVN